MDKRAKTKIAILSLVLTAIVFVSVFAYFVLALHDANVSINPSFVNSLVDQEYKVTVQNDVGSLNQIREVRVYDDSDLDGSRDSGIESFECGLAPSGWTLTDRLAEFNYCEYVTGVTNPARIAPSESLDFSFKASLSELNQACGNQFRISTIDDAKPIGEVEFNLPEVKVDDLPPITKKKFIGPQKIENGIEWIDGVSTIILEAEDQDPKDLQCDSGVDETSWRLSTTNDEVCQSASLCKDFEGSGDFNEYTGPIGEIDESCHVLEFYSIDNLGNVEKKNNNCFFVDKTPPEINKFIDEDEPQIGECPPSNSDDKCFITSETDITLECDDVGPHPSGDEVIWWRYRVSEDGQNWGVWLPGDDCDKITKADEEDGGLWCDWSTDKKIKFLESSLHELQFYCEDAVEKRSQTDIEFFRVDNDPPIITKRMLGEENVDWIGNCPPEEEGDKCYVADNNKGGVEISVKDNESIHAVDRVSCDYQVLLDGQEIDDKGSFTEHATILFKEDSTHDLVITCRDALGNTVRDIERFLVDSEPPETTKEYGKPFVENGLYHWINSSTPVYLFAEDEKIGVDKIFWRNTLLLQVPDKECVAECSFEGNGNWNEVNGNTTTFFKNEESCHLIEFYAVDKLGNKEDVKRQCIFVDNTPPESVKEIGEPKVLMCPADENGEDGNDEGENGNNIQLFNSILPGTNLRQINGSYSQSCGINTGIAFDGTNLIMSCWGHNNLDFLNPADGSLISTLDIPGYDGLMANAWDGTRNKLWQCAEHSKVLLVDTSDGSSVLYTHDDISCTDGLAYDGSDDTLWLSPDVSGTIYHYQINNDNTLTRIGTHLLSDLVGDCGNSGIAVGGDKLYLANDGCSEIYEAEKDLSSSTLFASFPERLEDMECDDITFAGQGVGAIWSQDAYDRIINAYAIPQGKCGFGGLPPEPACEDPMVFINQETEITITCKDSEPHPVDKATIHWRFKINDGNFGEWSWSEGDKAVIKFDEDSEHMIEYFCVDALGNEEEHNFETDIVDSQPPVINKTIVGPSFGQCPPEPESQESCYVDTATEILVDAVDPQPHPVNKVTCDWSYEVLDGDKLGSGQQGLVPPFSIKFPEDSEHELTITCRDALSNSVRDIERFIVDKIPPITEKFYKGDIFINEETGEEWISNNTQIWLSAFDPEPHQSGINQTFYRNTLVDERFCQNQEICQSAEGNGAWELWNGIPKYKNQESCHLIEFFSVDNVNKTEKVNKQCAYVDLTAPLPNKTVGKPHEIWTPGRNGQPESEFYPEANENCWIDGEGRLECWKITMFTPITLDCKDQEPHPVDNENVCFNVNFDGSDITPKYCEDKEGEMQENGYCCLLEEKAPATLRFGEESEHNLKFYCEDALGNRGPVDEEKFKVEGTTFKIWLNKKWNLISVPFVLLDNNITKVLEDVDENISAVWTYDGASGEWFVYRPGEEGTSNLHEINPGFGYWVLAKDMTMLELGGSLFSPQVTPPTRQLARGWNLVGYYGTENEEGEQVTEFHCPETQGKASICALNSLVDTTIGHNRWSSLLSYCQTASPLFQELDLDNQMTPGAGYWVEMDVRDNYAPATTCFRF